MFACTRLYEGINMADNHSLPDLLFSSEIKLLQTEVGKVWRLCGFLIAM